MTHAIADDPIACLLAEKHPRMSGVADLRKVARTVTGPRPEGVVLELGPWLGFLTSELGQHGPVHVADNFVWTKDHARRVPGLLEPGESFKPTLEAILLHLGVEAQFHEADFKSFAWSGPAISLLVIDSPKTAAALFDCLSSVLVRLQPGAIVLIKNGLNLKHHEMMAYVDRLIGAGVFAYSEDNDADDSNMLAIRATDRTVASSDVLADLLDTAIDGTFPTTACAQQPSNTQIAHIAQLVEAGLLSDAYASLAELSPDESNIPLWEGLEHTIKTDAISATDLAVFAEIFTLHNSVDSSVRPEENLRRGPMSAVRSFWTSNIDKPWRHEAFMASIFYRASEFGYMSWPQDIRDHLPGRDVLDVGCGSGLHGLGYLCLGANSVLGVDPSLRSDRDRVKNWASKSREPFGWTPAEISALISPWEAEPVTLDELDDPRSFDVAVLYDCLAHVDDVPGLIELVAGRLRPGGQMIFRHKNFYSWNGHGQMPKTVDDIDPNDTDQANLLDWKHVTWNAPEDHYISRSLNRVTIGDLLAAVDAHFTIDTLDERLSTAKTGLGRPRPNKGRALRHLTDRDFDTQSIFCVATVR